MSNIYFLIFFLIFIAVGSVAATPILGAYKLTKAKGYSTGTAVLSAVTVIVVIMLYVKYTERTTVMRGLRL